MTASTAPALQIVTAAVLGELSRQAACSPRKRMNHNIHPTDTSRSHRLLNAIEPGSYIPPHRHLDPEKDEGFVILSGRLGVVQFDDDGEIIDQALLDREVGPFAIDIPAGLYHTAVCLAPGTVFYETKAGPYLPLEYDELAPWAPEPSATTAPEYLARLCRLFTD